MRPVALKVDVDTHDGMKNGVPVLLDIFARHNVQATFCLSYGPDNSGKAIFRVLKDPAFAIKMFKTGAPSLYGLRTILSGTILPARPIALAFPCIVKNIIEHGHEIIVHAWNHRKWQDKLHKMESEEIAREYKLAFDAHKRLTGERPHAVASPGWQVTAKSLEIVDSLNLMYASDMREGCPCFPTSGEKIFKTLQLPGTGPCIEELIATGITDKKEMAGHLLQPLEDAVQPLLTLHAEVEGGPYSDLLDDILSHLSSRRTRCITLMEAAKKALENKTEIPVKQLCFINLPGRAGTVASAGGFSLNPDGLVC